MSDYSNLRIEKGVEMSNEKTRKLGIFYKIDIGDFVFVPGIAAKDFSGRLGYVKKKTGFKFTTRSMERDGVNGVGVWRVE